MTRRSCAGVVVASLLASAPLVAADVWESKPFHAWTDKELEKVLTSSPWAGKGSVTYVRSRANQPPIQEAVTVTWASARVMRQALAREEFGATPDVPAEAASVIAQTPPFYMVTVRISKGIDPARYARQAALMRDETFLQPRGKPPIPAQQAEGQVLDDNGRPSEAPEGVAGFPGGAGGAGGPAFAASPAQRGGGGAPAGGPRGAGTAGGPRAGGAGRAGRGGRGPSGAPPPSGSSLVIFRFPRDPITLDDRDVEFVTKLCGGAGTDGSAGAGAAVAPAPDSRALQFEVAAGAQRRGGGAPVGGAPPSPGVRMGDPLPACNHQVKKTFKLKDMVVRGELLL